MERGGSERATRRGEIDGAASARIQLSARRYLLRRKFTAVSMRKGRRNVAKNERLIVLSYLIRGNTWI